MNKFMNWFTVLIVLMFVVFSFIFPDFSLTISGGFAWSALLLSYFVGIILIVVGIFGGEVSFSSKGLVGWIKEIRNRNKNNKKENENG